MRKHIDYFYKSYDGMYLNELEKINNEAFNEYGYNFDSNRQRIIDIEKQVSRTNYNNCKKKLQEKGKI